MQLAAKNCYKGAQQTLPLSLSGMCGGAYGNMENVHIKAKHLHIHI